MPYELRPAQPADFAFAWALYRDLMQPLTVELLPWREEGQREVVAGGIASGAVQIVQIDGEPAGWIQINELSEAIEIGQLYLRPDRQGRGTGSALIADVQRRARAASKPVTLSVLRNNPRARALYERLGFSLAGSDAYKLHMRWSAPQVTVSEEPMQSLSEYADIPIAFEVDRVLQVELLQGGLGGMLLRERPVEPWRKDMDALDGNHPSALGRRFDLSRWGMLAARLQGRRVGGALLAHDEALSGREDTAVLWDLRVSPDIRRQGVGRALLEAAAGWGRARGASHLLIETQNVNVAACRFYAACGCELVSVQRLAYPELPGEVRLDWLYS